MIGLENIKTYSYENILNTKEKDLTEIVKHTENTWQEKRNTQDKIYDAKIGKIAESVVENYIKENIPNIVYVPYDNFRKDNFQKHAPFDGLLFHKDTPLNLVEEIKERVVFEINKQDNKFGKITEELKLDCLKKHIYLTEIKSTRIDKRHKEKEEIDFGKILKDDFLDYPKFLRSDKSNEIKNFNDYLNYINQRRKERNLALLSVEELKMIEKSNMKHIYIRVYVDEINKNCHIIGCISYKKFSENMVIKHMPKKDKSENAIYLSTNLCNGSDITVLEKITPIKENLKNKIKNKI